MFDLTEPGEEFDHLLLPRELHELPHEAELCITFFVRGIEAAEIQQDVLQAWQIGRQERGLAYRNYVEQNAALGFVIGIEWFSKYNGESFNTGLISVADRPWKDMLAEMMKTNHGIYDLLLGQRKSFAWDDARFVIPAGQ